MRDTERLKRAAIAVGLFTAALWVIRLSEAAFGVSLSVLGVRPGEPGGLVGVLTAPLVHGSFRHLLANTPPLLFLGTAMLYGFPRASRRALPLIWLGAGLGTWLFAREAAHIGASGITHGMLVFVFVAGVLRRDRLSIALALAVAFMYGGMIWGVLPLQPHISFESHLFGALSGLAAAFLLKRADPLPPRRLYEWEQDFAPGDEDPVIGDLWRQASAPERPLAAAPTTERTVAMTHETGAARTPPAWRRDLRTYLEREAAGGRTVTYDQATRDLGIEPPRRIHQLAEALEETMTEDAAAGRPFRAAVVVSRTGTGLPQRGFFLHARALGRYEGPDEGPQAAEFHARELASLRASLSDATPR